MTRLKLGLTVLPQPSGRRGSEMGDRPITWAERLSNLRKALGREPTLQELLDASQGHNMTPEEIKAQRASWARAMISTSDPRFD